MERGFFLSLDGLDGAGKSTQCQLLADWLRGKGFEVTRCSDPGGTEIGRQLREILLDRRRNMTLACEAFLFMASRAQLTAEVIRPALEAGQVVVSDRFLLANVVYQGHAGGLAPQLLHDMGLLSTGGLEPDLTVVLDLTVDAALSRRQGPADRVESRAADYHARVRAGFLAEAKQRPDRIRVVDACRPVPQVHDEVRRYVEECLKRRTK